MLFIADYLRHLSSITELCAQYGISRKTGYKWIERFEQVGIQGLNERRRRPVHSQSQVSYRIQQSIIGDNRGQTTFFLIHFV